MNRFLIVDDIPQNLYFLEILLKTNGYEVDQASNGAEALEIAHNKPPDMIIADILMPVMDGFNLCRIWKKEDQLKDIPFIFYTATYTDPKDKQFALSLGADRFLTKPMDPDGLLAIIREVLAGQDSTVPDALDIPELEEQNFFREYNDTLVRKLEDKMLQIQRSNSRLFTLFHTSNILGINKPVSESIHEVLFALVEKADYQKALYFSVDANRDQIQLQDAIGFTEDILKQLRRDLVFKVGEEGGLVGLVGHTGQPVNILNTSEEPRWIETIQGINSALLIPVRHEKNIYGVLALFDDMVMAFTEEDEHILTALANNLAISIEDRMNKSLIQKQIQRLSALHMVDRSINSSTDLTLTLNLILSSVISQLNVDAADIFLFNREEYSWKLAVKAGFLSNAIRNVSLDDSLSKQVILERRTRHFSEKDIDSIPLLFKHIWQSEGFSVYWGTPIIAKGVVKGVLEVFHRSPLVPNPDWLNFLETLAGQAAIAIENSEIHNGLLRSNMELTLAYDATIQGWSEALDLRDRETEGHTLRVTDMAVRFARKLGMRELDVLNVRRGALLHDIGKIGVPDSILHKPDLLSEDERDIMKKHPETAYNLISKIDYLQGAVDIPYLHHEKWDGSGYPKGLCGKEIPLAARLFAIIDVWDALSSDRPYRPAWTRESVLDYIRQNSGTHFDPDLVPVFIELLQEYSEK